MAATLLSPDGRTVPMPPRCLVGSGAVCHVRVGSKYTSYAHALFAWDGTGWSVADLASRNGTRVNGQVIDPKGPRRVSAGDRVVFGSAQSGEWVVTAAGPPQPFAVRLTDGACVTAVERTLLLPSDQSPEASLSQREDGTWAVETAAGADTLADEAILTLREPWRVYLPDDGVTMLVPGTLHLDAIRLHLRNPRACENVDAWIEHAGGTIPLGNAKHWELVWVLAKDRQEDTGPEFDRGWVDLATLGKEVGLPARSIATYVSRVRNQLDRVGVVGARDLVDGSRPNQRRLAIDAVLHDALAPEPRGAAQAAAAPPRSSTS